MVNYLNRFFSQFFLFYLHNLVAGCLVGFRLGLIYGTLVRLNYELPVRLAKIAITKSLPYGHSSVAYQTGDFSKMLLYLDLCDIYYSLISSHYSWKKPNDCAALCPAHTCGGPRRITAVRDRGPLAKCNARFRFH